MVNKFIKSIEIKKHVILNSFQTLFKKTGLPRSHSFARNDVLLCKKPAITLAEIIIVIFIVGIIAGVFLAMPKKNVGQTDKAKYYVAYDMLKRLQDEQMADSGHVALNQTNGPNDNFQTQVNNWLNTISINNNQATLTNGMILNWNNQNYDAINQRLQVTVDIDGANEGNCTNNQDCHNFFLTNDGRVVPQGNGANSTDWIAFKVYNFDDNGIAQFGVTNVSYSQAQDCFNGVTCPQCAGNPCFMEAIQPLGK